MRFTSNFKTIVSFFMVAIVLTQMLPGCKTAKKIQASIEKKDTTSVHITNTSAEDSLALIKNEMASLAKKRLTSKLSPQRLKLNMKTPKESNLTSPPMCGY